MLQLDFSPPRKPFFEPADLFKLSEASTVEYAIGEAKDGGCFGVPVSEFARATWPEHGVPIDFPEWVKRPNGSTGLEPYRQTPEVLPLLQQGDQLFAAKKYQDAAVFYRKVLEISPRDYLALLWLGDSAYQLGFLQEALELYQRAEASNPADLRSYFFQASVFSALGELEKGRDAYAEALIRAPRRETLRNAIASRAQRLGIVLQDDLLRPLVLVRRVSEKRIEICIASTTPQWIAYGMCKAVWLGEPAHREAMTGSTEHVFSSTEEKECFGGLLAKYFALREKKEVPVEPELERLSEVVLAKMADEFIVFELATRVAPQAPLYVSEGMRRRLKAYVRRFVLEPRQPAADGGPP